MSKDLQNICTIHGVQPAVPYPPEPYTSYKYTHGFLLMGPFYAYGFYTFGQRNLLVMRPLLARTVKKPLHTGVRTGFHYLLSLSVRLCVCQCMCNVRGFTDCESCTRPISTNPRPMAAVVFGLAHGTCFVARRLEVIAVAGLKWASWRVHRVRRDIVFFLSFFCSNAHGLLQVRGHLSLLTSLQTLDSSVDSKTARKFILAHANPRRANYLVGVPFIYFPTDIMPDHNQPGHGGMDSVYHGTYRGAHTE